MKITLSDLDHPVVFVFFLILVLVPVGAVMFLGARKVGIL